MNKLNIDIRAQRKILEAMEAQRNIFEEDLIDTIVKSVGIVRHNFLYANLQLDEIDQVVWELAHKKKGMHLSQKSSALGIDFRKTNSNFMIRECSDETQVIGLVLHKNPTVHNGFTLLRKPANEDSSYPDLILRDHRLSFYDLIMIAEALNSFGERNNI